MTRTGSPQGETSIGRRIAQVWWWIYDHDLDRSPYIMSPCLAMVLLWAVLVQVPMLYHLAALLPWFGGDS